MFSKKFSKNIIEPQVTGVHKIYKKSNQRASRVHSNSNFDWVLSKPQSGDYHVVEFDVTEVKQKKFAYKSAKLLGVLLTNAQHQQAMNKARLVRQTHQ